MATNGRRVASSWRSSETRWLWQRWAQQAERTAERLRKGHKVYVEGRIQTRQWEDQTGNKRYTTELIANQVSSLERRDRDEDAPFPDDRPSGGAQPAEGGTQRPPSSGGEDDFDDLPF